MPLLSDKGKHVQEKDILRKHQSLTCICTVRLICLGRDRQESGKISLHVQQRMRAVPKVFSCTGESSCRHMPAGAEENVAFEEILCIPLFQAMDDYN